MFQNVGMGELVVLIVAGLFILGPERLPSGAAWLAQTIRQVKDYATGARDQLKNELGPEFDELRKPLDELRGLRNFNPRTAATRALFDDPAPKPNGFAPAAGGATAATNGTPSLAKNGTPNLTKNGAPQSHPATAEATPSLAKGERPPIDLDAT